ncbi:MAG: TolC family protein [Flammeovirgaceae bacterium]
MNITSNPLCGNVLQVGRFKLPKNENTRGKLARPTSSWSYTTFRRLTSSFFLLLFTTSIYAQSLNDYIQYAYENNPSLKAAYTKFEIALQKIPQVKTLPNPQLSFGYFISPVETRLGPQQARISLNQQFPWFGTLKAKGEVATLEADMAYQVFLEEKNRLAYEVKKAYYPLIEIQEQIELLQKNLVILNTYKSLTTQSFSNGKGTLADALRVGMLIEEEEVSLQLLNDRIRPLEIAFNRLINRGDSLAVKLEAPVSVTTATFTNLKDSIRARHPKLAAWTLKEQAAKAQELVEQKKALPSFGIGLDYALVGNRTDANPTDNGRDILMPMVSLSLPIAKKRNQAARKVTQLNQLASQTNRAAIENELMVEYELHHYEMTKAVRMNALYAKQLKQTQQIIDLLLTEYSHSGKDFEEVLRMQQQLLQYHMAKATVEKEYQLALAKLAYLTVQLD